MHRAVTTRCLGRALRPSEISSAAAGVPLFLCPALARWPSTSHITAHTGTSATSSRSIIQRRSNHTEAANAPISIGEQQHASITENRSKDRSSEPDDAAAVAQRNLPITCRGCGAFSQTTDADQLGYYDPTSKRVRNWVRKESKRTEAEEGKSASSQEDEAVKAALGALSPEQMKELGLDYDQLTISEDAQGAEINEPAARAPVCDRCHILIHESGSAAATKVPMFHPTVESLRETIEESPHKHNHIYHVIDAADFPMSLVPRLNVLLGDIPMRSKNRRSRSGKYMNDRKMELSFVITRGDLLGPTKEIVDSLMPYLREVLRDALGRVGGRVRLGNIHCVSASRDWWTGELKQNIWYRGGAGWMVGKVNVGKSRLFESIYPKGRVTRPSRGNITTPKQLAAAEAAADSADAEELDELRRSLDFGDLLPPAQPLEMYPEMPVVSSLPGTTASPIRVPFGDRKGELIDLPGLARSDLELFVKEEDRQSLIMKKRIVPEQVSLKAGQSILLGGGLIRIAPTTSNLTFLTYNFTPLHEHFTSNEKAEEFLAQTRKAATVPDMRMDGVGEKMQLAGVFELRYDVTKKRAGPLTRKDAVGLKPDRLPFRVLSVDILIEGVGYVEIVAQVRARDMEDMLEKERLGRSREMHNDSFERNPEQKPELPVRPARPAIIDPFQQMEDQRIDGRTSSKAREEAPPPSRSMYERSLKDWPSVEVFSPEGRFVDYRQPINGWLNNKPRVLDKHRRARPRKSMTGHKKNVKVAMRREAAGE